MRRDPRPLLLVALALFAAVAVAAIGRVDVPSSYHEFADGRAWLGLPMAADVLSNLAFLTVGLLGLARMARSPRAAGTRALSVFFVGVCAVALGSSYYHSDSE